MALDLSKWAPKNPIGVLALFLSVIYGIGSGLLTLNSSVLTPENQTTLVWFVVLFPVAVLVAFSWLVSCHHTKLYGPQDFPSEQGFLDVLRILTPAERREKLEEEAIEPQIEGPPILSDATQGANEPQHIPEDPAARKVLSSESRLKRALLAQTLALNQLQTELGLPLVRDVGSTLGGKSFRFDAVGTSNDQVTIIETKLIRPGNEYARRIREGLGQLRSYRSASVGEWVRTKAVLAVVVDAGPGDDDLVAKIKNITLEGIEVRAYLLRTLAEQAGISLSDVAE